jgi:DNA-binding protein HU-beta
MNNKELTAALSTKLNMSKNEITDILQAMVDVFYDELGRSKSIGIQGFGSFEVRKKEERLSVHPATQIRTLVPPKLVVNFKQSPSIKEKLKDQPRYEK